MQELATEDKRRRAIAWAMALTTDTTLAPDQYEVEMLEQFAQGHFTLAELQARLDNRIQHLLYRSKATQAMTTHGLTQLVEQCQRWNEAHQVTGLLCYSSDGNFVQVLEGPAQAVHALYARIQLDTRHTDVITLSDQASSDRWFADWKMALVETEPQDFFWLIGYLEARTSNLVKPQIPIVDPQLLTLLAQFSKV
jgi:hypothetical protein